MAQHQNAPRRQETVTKQQHTPPGGLPPKGDEKPPRRVRLGNYKSFRIQRKSLAPAYEDRGVPGSFKLLKNSIKLLWKHKRPFGYLTLIFGAISLVVAGGFFDPSTLLFATEDPAAVDGAQAEADGGEALTILLALGALLATGGSQEFAEAATALRGIMLMLATMAIIWALRQASAGKAITQRGAWYSGTAAIVPFALVLGVLFLEAIPLAFGGYLFISLVADGVTMSFLEDALATLVAFLIATITFYWLAASIFALHIVTLPGTGPVAALRSANELVRYRRALVLRRLLMPLIWFTIIGVLIIVPVALTLPAAAGPVFFIMSTAGFVLFNTYVYQLYRELIG